MTQNEIATRTGKHVNTIARRLREIEAAQAASPMWAEVVKIAADLPAQAVKGLVHIAMDPKHKDHFEALKTILKAKPGGHWLSEKINVEVSQADQAERLDKLRDGQEAFSGHVDPHTPDRGPNIEDKPPLDTEFEEVGDDE